MLLIALLDSRFLVGSLCPAFCPEPRVMQATLTSARGHHAATVVTLHSTRANGFGSEVQHFFYS